MDAHRRIPLFLALLLAGSAGAATVEKAAAVLGISERNIYRLIEKYGMR